MTTARLKSRLIFTSTAVRATATVQIEVKD
jgi:hypothetical protein